MFKKSKITIWTDGRFARTELGELESVEDVQSDMTHDRQSHAMYPSTLAIEETATTLVVVKESGTVHVYNWSKD
jgi:hypothetical protein